MEPERFKWISPFSCNPSLCFYDMCLLEAPLLFSDSKIGKYRDGKAKATNLISNVVDSVRLFSIILML